MQAAEPEVICLKVAPAAKRIAGISIARRGARQGDSLGQDRGAKQRDVAEGVKDEDGEKNGADGYNYGTSHNVSGNDKKIELVT